VFRYRVWLSTEAANRAIYLMTKTVSARGTIANENENLSTGSAALSTAYEDERKSEILIDSPRTASDSTDPISLRSAGALRTVRSHRSGLVRETLTENGSRNGDK
jgi:hypothetical protein